VKSSQFANAVLQSAFVSRKGHLSKRLISRGLCLGQASGKLEFKTGLERLE